MRRKMALHLARAATSNAYTVVNATGFGGYAAKNVKLSYYQKGPLPSRLSWCGSDTLLRFIAVLWMQAQRKRSSAEMTI